MGWSRSLHTETPANKCEQAWWAPVPTHWEAWPSVTSCQQPKRFLTCFPFAGCTRLCPPLSAQSSMRTSSAWGSSGGCAPERSKGTGFERNAPHPLSLAANQLSWSPRGPVFSWGELKNLCPQGLSEAIPRDLKAQEKKNCFSSLSDTLHLPQS